ncbi:hypothetical protein PRZ48_013176 [Zasmidium cellare]|uniref:DUF1330 domain-containing protein n=1 Tax=Zasmidium cellare TaxID=395010 RepID=A0ABR0E3S8_ZASCE|nr:hypothetical protein PRZ48_013176 [Zasmidium cellare]
MLAVNWDMALAVESEIELPASVTGTFNAFYKVDLHVENPSLNNDTVQSTSDLPEPPFHDRSPKALCTQFHQITPSLLALADHPLCPQGPISMLNFVSYHPYPSAVESYQKYLDGVRAGPAKRYGNFVKLKGSPTPSGKGEWDLVFMAHYPSFKHFVDMGLDPEYQELNRRYRMPALRDLCILMTTEVDLAWPVTES